MFPSLIDDSAHKPTLNRTKKKEKKRKKKEKRKLKKERKKLKKLKKLEEKKKLEEENAVNIGPALPVPGKPIGKYAI